MVKDVFTFIVGGKAGEGVKKAGSVVAHIFSNMGRHVFQMDDYMSLIRGGHNFSVVSTSIRWISNHYMKADLIVNFDKRSCETHLNNISENGIIVFNSDEQENIEGIGIPFNTEAKKYPNKELMYGVGAVAILSSAIGLKKEEMNNIIKSEYPSSIEDNISFAEKIYDMAYPLLGSKFKLEKENAKTPILTGNESISLGAIASGLDIYYGYPMTPASSILHYLASLAPDFGLAVVHPESELAVINMAIGSSFAGTRSMVGTSGGGFALMTEGFSLAGMVEAPILVILSMRPAPATGVPTYTEQGDLNFALNAGHGEFLRIVASPGTIEESYYLTAQLLDLVWKFQTPGILLTEKHLSESSMTVNLNIDKAQWAEPKEYTGNEYKRYLNTDDGISPMLFPPSDQLIKWNSYEHDEVGFTTENPQKISVMHDKRYKKVKAIHDYLKAEHTVNVFGDEGPEIFTYGSTTMSVLEAIKYGNIEAKVIQPIFLSPLPVWELEKYKSNSCITIEMSKEGQFAQLLQEKASINTRYLINKYNGRPFDPIDLSNQIKEVI